MATQMRPAGSVARGPHFRRRMTEQEKIEYRKRRLLRACSTCALSKRKCNHTLAEREPRVVQNPISIFERLSDERTSLAIRPSGTGVSSPAELFDQALVRTGDLSWPAPRVQDESENPEDDKVLDSFVSSDDTRLILQHKPQSAESLSVLLFAENVEWAGVADSWFGEAPRRLGHDSCYDLAIDALMMCCWYGRNLPGATLSKVYRAMGASLDVLHTEMSKEGAVLNEHILTTVAALSPVDAISTGSCFLVSSHLDGVASILVSQAAVMSLSSTARRILEFHFCDTYVMSTMRGVPSPFEAVNQRYCEYTDTSKPAAERKIRAIGNRLCVRLPRLIMLVRLASGAETNASTVLSAINLASELLELQDDASEADFLEAVGLVLTKLPRDRRVTEYSINFKSLSNFEAGAYYWHTRSVLLKLCSRLRSSFPSICNMYALPSLPMIQDELHRYALNIFMSVQYARTNTARKRRRLLGQSLLACWSTLQEFPVAFADGIGVEDLQSWLLETLNVALLGRNSSIEARDLDVAAETFSGGSLGGRYKDLYDPPKHVYA